MKNYRVWEANRKVFLYPENWIEPELRDDKTPFFKELENELLQTELDDATAERRLCTTWRSWTRSRGWRSSASIEDDDPDTSCTSSAAPSTSRTSTTTDAATASTWPGRPGSGSSSTSRATT